VERLYNIIEYCVGLWSKDTILHPSFTLHGVQHSKNVEKIVRDILAPEHKYNNKILNEEELFYLLAAVWLHDIGMITKITNEEIEICKSEKMEIQDWIRKEHHNRSYSYIINNAEKLWIDETEANSIALISKAHRKIDLFQLPVAHNNIRLLGAILRIADELDVTCLRAPKALMFEIWNSLDEIGKWHWIKHYCVKKSKHIHEELKDESPMLLRLNYSFIISIPDIVFENIFWHEIIKPLKRVLQHEHVDVLLRQKHITIQSEFFICSNNLTNEALPDGNSLYNLFERNLKQEKYPDDDFNQILNTFSRPIVDILKRQLNIILKFGEHSQHLELIKSYILEYLTDLHLSNNSAQIYADSEKFKINFKNFCDKISDEYTLKEEIEIAWMKFYEMGRRFLILVKGKDNERIAQLRHIIYWLGEEASSLYGFIATNDQNNEIKLTAAQALVKFATHEEYDRIIEITKDPIPEIRIEGIKALKHVWGKKAYQRIAEIIGTDLDSGVRRIANDTLQKHLIEKNKISEIFNKKRILLAYDILFEVPPLVDALEYNGAEVIVETNFNKLKTLIESWKPEIAIIELHEINLDIKIDDHNLEDFPGILIGKLLRKILGDKVFIIATSLSNPEKIIGNLTELNCHYIQKPNTVTSYIQLIDTLINNNEVL